MSNLIHIHTKQKLYIDNETGQITSIPHLSDPIKRSAAIVMMGIIKNLKMLETRGESYDDEDFDEYS